MLSSHIISTTSSEFIMKLFLILEEPENYPYISWSRDGRSFIISDQEGFSEFVLEKHFRHKNWSSFVRQLNKYDFSKVRNDDGRNGYEVSLYEYKNKYFQRARPDLLSRIKRKKAPSEKSISPDDPHIKKIENNVIYQAHVLNAVKEISKYLQTVTEDINEIKKYMYQERKKRHSQIINVLLIQESLTDLSYIHDILKLHNCYLTAVEGNEHINKMSSVSENQDIVILYATSPYCSAIIKNIRKNDVGVPIILIIGREFRDRYVGTLGIGATDVLLMPFKKEELTALIDKYRMMKV